MFRRLFNWCGSCCPSSSASSSSGPEAKEPEPPAASSPASSPRLNPLHDSSDPRPTRHEEHTGLIGPSVVSLSIMEQNLEELESGFQILGLHDWLTFTMLNRGESECLSASCRLLARPLTLVDLDFERTQPDEHEQLQTHVLAGLHLPPEEAKLIMTMIQSIDKLVAKTLESIRNLVDNDQDPPVAMLALNHIAQKELGWFLIIHSMIRCIPAENPLGPATISILMDDCPLPTAATMRKLCEQIQVIHRRHSKRSSFFDKNVAIVLGFMAEKLAGSRCQEFFCQEILEYFVGKLVPEEDPSVILYSMLTLEKFAQTSENKIMICRYFEEEFTKRGLETPLIRLEALSQQHPEDLIIRQVSFCAQWCLDNIFIQSSRPFSYLKTDMRPYNVILNANDVSEYLKISPTGLEARSDASSFESVRCTTQVGQGAWYYEATIVTTGIMQIGWAAKQSKFLNHDGFGIGDDEFSVAFDGCRQLLWHGAQSHSIQDQLPKMWCSGDVMGTLIDFDKKELCFWLNGRGLAPVTWLFEDWRGNGEQEYFPAASFMSFQHCLFNFGVDPFKFPPHGRNFRPLNDNLDCILSDEDKMILPRHVKLEAIRQISIHENACSLCFDRPSTAVINPCSHAGFCEECSQMLEVCPLCRGPIESITHAKGPEIGHQNWQPETDCTLPQQVQT
ncbi:RING finger and SPRY domain-containing protein 1-like [Tigriopus californicus]|uniref:RING finger and SPRY domain-containing protein 1-like n=1 Tax=Tigriopus californicus TaxID=6832 RepID=UPI0027DA008E|nr:RING finger and SPRY domain-containing protein 1-like [Tigriopus californicus]